MKQELILPKGVKATVHQDGDIIVVEYEEEPMFKAGDFVTSTWGASGIAISILADKYNGCNSDLYSFSHLSSTGEIVAEFGYIGTLLPRTDRPSTEPEKQQLLDAMHAAGKDWDAEKMDVVDLGWRPKKGERYWFLSTYGFTDDSCWDEYPSDNARFYFGNCFQTKEQAEKYKAFLIANRKNFKL